MGVSVPNVWNVARGISCSALALQIWEFFHGFPDEVELIWSQPRNSSTFLYVWSRYFPLTIQIFSLVMNEHLSIAQTRPRMCNIIIGFRALCSQLTLACVEMIMVMRVHLLYNRSRRAQYFLKTIYAIGFSLEAIGQASIIAHLEIEIASSSSSSHKAPAPAHDPCIVNSYGTWMWLVMFATGAGTVESTLLVMTGIHILKVRQWQWLRTPLAGRMLRDGFIIFLFFVVVACTVISMEIVEQLPPVLWNAAFAWYISILSVAGCRLILSMRRLVVPAPTNNDEVTEFQLTSVVFTDHAQCNTVT